MTRPIPRAETVGSLLRPPSLLENRSSEAEDAAVLDAIALQESAGLDVITDGEMRRGAWSVTAEALNGLERRERAMPHLQWRGEGKEVTIATYFPTVVRFISERHDLAQEYAFLARHAHTRTKYCIPAPSYHRRFWHPEHSSEAYPTCEDFLIAVRDYERALFRRLVALGCDYIQLDAPNYGSLCDADQRSHLEAEGHDLDAELEFDAALDSSVFEGLSGITRALHVCRGNAAGRWHSTGGYGVIADQLFPNLAVDALLLEYDSDRAGDFAPLACVPEGTVAVLGLVTTKSGGLEDEAAVEARIVEATAIKPLKRLALSPQCGFASLAIGNPVTPEEQRAKLELVARVAHRVWPA